MHDADIITRASMIALATECLEAADNNKAGAMADMAVRIKNDPALLDASIREVVRGYVEDAIRKTILRSRRAITPRGRSPREMARNQIGALVETHPFYKWRLANGTHLNEASGQEVRDQLEVHHKQSMGTLRNEWLLREVAKRVGPTQIVQDVISPRVADDLWRKRDTVQITTVFNPEREEKSA